MYYVYLLKSENYNWYYVGFTANIENRLNEHNLGRVKSTKKHRPYKIIYTEIFNSRYEARNIEKKYKIHSNKEKLIKKSEQMGGFSSVG